MTKYYLRIEGVNLPNFIDDTADLSTIRGAGLSLLNAIDQIPKIAESVKLQPISTGASSGFFRFKVPDETNSIVEKALVEKALAEIRYYLNHHTVLKHATFVMNILPSSGKEGFIHDRESLIALNRRSQMCSPRLAIPIRNKKTEVNVCGIDNVKPGTEINPGVSDEQNETHLVSPSVEARKLYGQGQKRGAFYEEYSEMKPAKDFALHFDELTKDDNQGNLNHKMAVIYLDGNSFGKIQSKCDSSAELNKWDTKIKDYRKALLRSILQETLVKKEWVSREDNYRFETLLWGGDEMTWVVPAWQGWNMLSFFYQKSLNWEYGERLTHAGGMVFCHHNAPIHRITKLAKNLAERAKIQSRNKNLFAYQVLESFDHVGMDMDRLRKAYHAPQDTDEALILPGDSMDRVMRAFAWLKNPANGFPRRKLYELIQNIRLGNHNYSDIDELKKKMNKETKDIIYEYFSDNETLWFHVAELWDYIGIREN